MIIAARTVCLIFLSLATLSCSSVAPVKVAAGDQCFRCRRAISEVRVAAEMIVGDHEYFVSKFRGPGCMAKYIAGHPDPTATVFVTDYPTGEMIGSRDAFYVPVVVDRKTNETDYRAYARRPEAAAAAFELRTTAIRWDAVLDKAH
jgi:hypothetical protein